MSATVIEQQCTVLSPPLLIEATSKSAPPEVRFMCQRPANHPGGHKMGLTWSGEELLIDQPPWRGAR